VDELPDVDEHVRVVAASPDRTWRGLLAVVAGSVRRVPAPLAAAWGLDHRVRTGDWSRPGTGDAIPGFVVAAVDPPRALALRGRHRFSRYEVRFTLEPVAADRVELHATTSAVFPGPLGRAYRLLVIGSGGHAVVVGRLLARVARRAERP
jgi:hypothetical protein